MKIIVGINTTRTDILSTPTKSSTRSVPATDVDGRNAAVPGSAELLGERAQKLSPGRGDCRGFFGRRAIGIWGEIAGSGDVRIGRAPVSECDVAHTSRKKRQARHRPKAELLVNSREPLPLALWTRRGSGRLALVGGGVDIPYLSGGGRKHDIVQLRRHSVLLGEREKATEA